MSFQPGNKTGRQFTSTNQPKNTGRKPGLFKKLASIANKELYIQLSREDFTRLQRWILEQTKADLLTLKRNPETPLFIIVLITAILSDVEDGKFDTIQRTFDRVFGRSIQPIQIENDIEEDHRFYDFVKLDDESLEQIGEILNRGAKT